MSHEPTPTTVLRGRSAWRHRVGDPAERHGELRRALFLAAACFLLFVFLPRLLLQTRVAILASSDSAGYTAIAERLAAGDIWDPRLGQLRLPGYPLFLAALVRTVGLSSVTLAWSQMVCGLLVVAGALILLLRSGGAARTCLCALLLGLNPVLLLFEHWWMSEILFVFFSLGLLLTAIELRFAPVRFHEGVALGIAASAVLLTRANGAALVAVCLAFVILQYFRPAAASAVEPARRPTAAGLIGGAAALALLLGAWVARNAVTAGLPLYLAGGEQARLAYTVLLDVAGDAEKSRQVLGPGYDPRNPASIYRLIAELRRAHPSEVERAARKLRLALVEGRSGAHWRARLSVLAAFFGDPRSELPMKNVATTLSHGWIDPSPEFFLRAQRTEFWARYELAVPDRSRALSLVGRAGLGYLRGGRAVLYTAFALVACLSLARHRSSSALHVRVTILLLLSAAATAALHAWTLAGIDRFSTSFDWIPTLGLAHCVTRRAPPNHAGHAPPQVRPGR